MADLHGCSPADAALPLIGRNREQVTLRAALDAALAGHGSLILIGGEAGIGKTTLAETFLAEATDRGAVVLVGRCYDHGETPPYGPWVELCARFLAGSALPPPLGAGEAAESQPALFARVRDTLADVAHSTPIVLLLEDLHWADAASLDLLRVVGRGLGTLPLLLLGTYRDDELAEGRPLAASLPALVREAHATRLTLARLGATETGSLVRSRYQLPPGDEARLTAHLHAHAEGNPLYLGELLRSLEEQGVLHSLPDAGGWALGDLAGTRVPPLLRQIIGARVARLGEDAGRLLAVAAVIGQEVPLDLWSAVAEANDDALAAVVGSAVAARVLAETPDGQGVRFAHALVHEALYEAMPLPRRRILHHRVADALLATPAPHPDAVAHHLQHAGDPRATTWLIEAGHRARRAYAWLAAAERYEAARRLLEHQGIDAAQRGWLLGRLAGLYRYHDTPRALAYLSEGAALGVASGDRSLVANARFDHGLFLCFQGDFHGGLPEMESGLELMGARTPEELAHAAAMMEYTPGMERGALALWLALAGHYDRARQMAEDLAANESARRGFEGEGESASGDNQFGLLCAYAALGQPDDARLAHDRARDAYQRAHHHNLIGRTAIWALCAVALPYAADDLPARRRLANEAEEAWQRTSGGAMAAFPVGIAQLPLLVLEGRWAEAQELDPTEIEGWFVAPHLARLARAQGETAHAWRLIRAWLPDGPHTAPGGAILFTGLALVELAAALALDEGDLPLARPWLELHDRWLAWSGAVLGRAEGQLGWATYHRAAGDSAAARDAAARALSHASDPRQPLALLATHRILGELAAFAGDYAKAASHLDTALALADACAAPYERALTLLSLAELRLAAGQPEAARGSLGEAHPILANLGARPALARCERLAAQLQRPNSTPTRPPGPTHPVPAPYPCSLTAREVEVLRLIAAGKSNRQMADALCRSERTVERHIENIYRKIGAHSKADATAFAFRHRLA